jgi:hypothetical protein
MDCTIKTKMLDSWRWAYLITNGSGVSVYMPPNVGDPKAWDYIRFRLEKGDRIADAYEKAGYKDIVPPDYLKQAIKDIYLYNHTGQLDPISGDPIDKPYGDWVNEQACQVLNMTDNTGRINLGDGFVVPNIAEQDCIRGKILYENVSIAYYECAPDIIAPLESLPYIEDKLLNTIQAFYEIIKDAHITYKAVHNIPRTGTNDSDRVFLGDGFTIPSTKERGLLYDAVLVKGKDLTYAFSVICPDITPPADAMGCIDHGIRSAGTMTDWSVFYNDCHDQYVKSKQKESPGSNILIFALLLILGIAAVSRR